MFQKLFRAISQHKITTGFLVIVIILGLYFGYKRLNGSSTATHYVLAAVQQGTIITSVSGSGQVSVSNQVDVKPKVSGDVVYVGVKNGQEVYAGQVLAYLDSRDAQRSVRDAQISLESAQISLEKMRRNQETSGETTTDNLSQSYKDAYNKVSDSFLDLPNLVELARSVLYDNNVDLNGCGNVCEYGNLAGQDFRLEFKSITTRAENDYKIAKDAYDPNFATYRNVRLDASPEEITSVLKTTEKTAELLAQAIKSERNMLDALVNNINDEATKQGHKGQVPQQVTTYQNSIGSAVSNLNSILLSLGNARRSIESAQKSLEDSALTNPIDIRSQENTVKQKETALADAQEDLSNCYIRVPFGGIVAKVNMKKGDSVSGSTAVATVITKQQIAEITLNEIDVAKIKTGQKATLTFDAAPDLSVAGEVAEIDTLGTVSQGVVSYAVKITFGTQNEQIKPGMSVSADIITNAKQNVLLIPNSAVKSAGEASYVEMPQDATVASQLLANAANSATGIILSPVPRQQAVEIGLSNDSVSEVTSGLKAGDLVITRTITSSSTTTQTQSTQTRSIFGGSSGGGGSTRNVMPLRGD